MKYDFLIVGCGLFGSTFAREAANAGLKCLIIDKRNHIGGNVYSKQISGIETHMYGPHIFNTNSKKVWDYVNSFTEFNSYRHQVKSFHDGFLYSFPLNLNTLEELYGSSDDQDLIKMINVMTGSPNTENAEKFAISVFGREIYKKFIYGYTKKKWGREPKHLPYPVTARLSIKRNRCNHYHTTTYSGVPKEGYTKLIENLIDDIPCLLGQDYLSQRDFWDKQADRIVYTGAIDDFFHHEYGKLEWISLRFEHETKQDKWHQTVAQINYPDIETDYLRTVEHKHFTGQDSDITVVTTEYPQKYTGKEEKYYPVSDRRNLVLFRKYKSKVPEKYIFGGRLANYRYYDMDQVIASAIKTAKGKI